MAVRGDKALAYLAAYLGTNRNVLQVRIAGRQPPGAGDSLVERGVYLPSHRIDKGRQSVGIGGFELGHFAPLNDFPRNLVALGSEVFEHFRAGRVTRFSLLPTGQFQFVEQNFLKLLGRADRKRLSGNFEYFRFQPGDLCSLVFC